MNTKQIILISTVMGFTLPAIAAVATIAMTLKDHQNYPATPLLSRTKELSNLHMTGCGCPFCQTTFQEKKSS